MNEHQLTNENEDLRRMIERLKKELAKALEEVSRLTAENKALSLRR